MVGWTGHYLNSSTGVAGRVLDLIRNHQVHSSDRRLRWPCADWRRLRDLSGSSACPTQGESSEPMPNISLLLPGIVGAFVGVIGWLFPGMYIQRRQFLRQGKKG